MNKFSISGGKRKTQKKGCNSKRKMKGGETHIYEITKVAFWPQLPPSNQYEYYVKPVRLLYEGNTPRQMPINSERLVDGLKTTTLKQTTNGKMIGINKLQVGDYIRKEYQVLFSVRQGNYTLVDENGAHLNISARTEEYCLGNIPQPYTDKWRDNYIISSVGSGKTTKKSTTKKPVKKTTTKKPAKKPVVKKSVKKSKKGGSNVQPNDAAVVNLSPLKGGNVYNYIPFLVKDVDTYYIHTYGRLLSIQRINNRGNVRGTEMNHEPTLMGEVYRNLRLKPSAKNSTTRLIQEQKKTYIYGAYAVLSHYEENKIKNQKHETTIYYEKKFNKHKDQCGTIGIDNPLSKFVTFCNNILKERAGHFKNKFTLVELVQYLRWFYTQSNFEQKQPIVLTNNESKIGTKLNNLKLLKKNENPISSPVNLGGPGSIAHTYGVLGGGKKSTKKTSTKKPTTKKPVKKTASKKTTTKKPVKKTTTKKPTTKKLVKKTTTKKPVKKTTTKKPITKKPVKKTATKKSTTKKPVKKSVSKK